MSLFVQALNQNLKEKSKKKPNKITQNFNVPKSGLFTGTKSSLTYQKNHLNHLSNHSLGLNKNNKIEYLNDSVIYKLSRISELSDLSDLSENIQDSSVTYKRNVKDIHGNNSSAVPHSVISKTISNNSPRKLINGKVPGIFNTNWGQQIIQRKTRNITRLFKNNQQG